MLKKSANRSFSIYSNMIKKERKTPEKSSEVVTNFLNLLNSVFAIISGMYLSKTFATAETARI